MSEEKLRIDKYLWAIRIFKTRSQAANAISQGKVSFNGANIKPSKMVAVGERYQINTPERKWTIEVSGLLNRRLAFQEAINYYIDHTPPQEQLQKQKSSFVEYTGKRISRQGRPTKRDRRNLDEFS